MNTRELIELAQLDALGLLDDAERQAFERAFAAAPPAVRAMLREEQARYARIDALLPTDEPPAGLRQRVMDRVRAARAEQDQTAPAPLRLVGGSGEALPISRSRRVSPLWRAAAVGFASAAVLLGAVTLAMFRQFDDMRRSMREQELIASVAKTFGTRYVEDVLFHPQTTRVSFRRAEGAAGAEQASVFINPDWANALFFSANMASPQGGTYRLVVVDENNRIVREVGALDSIGGRAAHELPAQSIYAAKGGRTDRRLAISLVDQTPQGPTNTIIMTEADAAG
jgi:anti-sigma-K factor RskA